MSDLFNAFFTGRGSTSTFSNATIFSARGLNATSCDCAYSAAHRLIRANRCSFGAAAISEALSFRIAIRASLMITAPTGSVGFATPPTDCSLTIPAYKEANMVWSYRDPPAPSQQFAPLCLAVKPIFRGVGFPESAMPR